MRLINELSKQLWNIGFCECNPDSFIKNKGLPRIKWMRHHYRDRWFADPFLYTVTDKKIVVFVEEFSFSLRKGVLCELEIERTTMRLLQRWELLSLDTHLSYPIWMRIDGKTYVYPENGMSGHLCVYEYNEKEHKLYNPTPILMDAVADSSIIRIGETFYLVATKYPNTQKDLYLYSSSSFWGPYSLTSIRPVQTDKAMSRPGGNWFIVNNQIYRPGQNCKMGYGKSLAILRTFIDDSSYNEAYCFKVEPGSFRYNLGLHTINFLDGLCVIDSHGYKFPMIGRVLDMLRKLRGNKI